MARLQRSGLEMVAKNANQFITDIDKATKATERFGIALQKATQVDPANVFDRSLPSAKKLADNLNKVAKATENAGRKIRKTGNDVEVAEDSIAALRNRAKELKKELEGLSRSDPKFQKITKELQDTNTQIKAFNASIRGSRQVVESAEGSYRQLSARLSNP